MVLHLFFKMNQEYARTLMLEMRVSKNFIKTKAYKSFKPFTNKILEIIEEWQREGIIRKDIKIYLIRQLILGILEHSVTRWLLKGGKYNLMEHFNEVSELVFYGITNSKGLHRWNDSSKVDIEHFRFLPNKSENFLLKLSTHSPLPTGRQA